MAKDNYREKVTYLSKEEIICPVCSAKFYKEMLLTGGGRLIADEITDTLHRKFKASQKYGKIYPLIYSLIVCPDCYFSSFPSDFPSIPLEEKEKILSAKKERIEFVNSLLGEPIDFSKYRTLESGAASYVLAVLCYEYFPKKFIPVIKQAICSIRAAYLFEDLNEEKKEQNFELIAQMFYKKALFFYKRALELNQLKEQIMESLKNFGPDIDKNYGYDGILYLISVLTYKYGSKESLIKRKNELERARLYLGKLFGLGKSNINKPKEILEKSKYYHQLISQEIKEIDDRTEH